jgi:hypothetical protein
MSQTVEIPSRSIFMTVGKVGKNCYAREVSVEQDDNISMPRHTIVACSMSRDQDDNMVLLQIINVSYDI